jgi:hypothetical protein
VQTVRVGVADAPELMETVALLRVAVGPVGETDVVRVMLPLKPLMLDRVTVDVVQEPAGVATLEGLAVMEKSGDGALLLKVAAWTVSGTSVGVPLATETHTPPLTLVFAQPIWKPRLIPDVVPVMLYIAVNRRPVVGVVVMPVPGAEVATK